MELNKQDLDRHITGNWGEDSVPQTTECPDCGDDVEVDTFDNFECENCGHVFYVYEAE